MMKSEVRVSFDDDALARDVAAEIARLSHEAVARSGDCSFVLSGGSTPKRLFAELASDRWRDRLPWKTIKLFWGDERHVAPDHPDSNYWMAKEALISKVPVPLSNVHRVKSELPDAREAAQDYEHIIRSIDQLAPSQVPRFDIVLLGLGNDGHTASLFPHTAALRERERLVASNWVEKLATHRITMTMPVLNHAATVIVLVSGEGKAEILRTVLEGERNPDEYPAQLIQPDEGRVVWAVDRAAARLLSSNTGMHEFS